MKFLSNLAVSIIFTTLSILLGGFALSILWNWFIFPLGAIHLKLIQAIGIQFVFNYTTYHLAKRPIEGQSHNEQVISAFFSQVIVSAIFLSIGSIIHWCF